MIDKYDYRVTWSEEDQVFIATVSEFTFLTAHGDTPEKALKEIRFVVEAVVKDLKENKEHIPDPLSIRRYSGKLNLRMPEGLHCRLAQEAARQNISLNQLINLKLAS